MRKLIAAINMTLDGFCDHNALQPDEEIHDHYTALLAGADLILYGRITYGLMQFWQTLVEQPSGKPSMDDFAAAIDRIPKLVFSRTLKHTGWHSATLADQPLKEAVEALKQQPGGVILAGSRSMMVQLMKLGLVDELQLCIHPVIAGAGLPLFETLEERMELKRTGIKNFSSGATILYYQPEGKTATEFKEP